MIDNERKKPFRLRQIEALFNRLPKSHPRRSEIEKERAIRRAGFRGEQNVDYHLSFLSKSDMYTVLKDIYLEESEHTFQIDTLLISPKFILIIEAKNYSGTLHIDPHTNQLIQNNVTSFPNPILQAKRQQKLLQQWLHKKKFPVFPIEYVVAFHERSSIIQTSIMNKRLFSRIIYAENIEQKIDEFENIYKTEVIDRKTICRLNKLIRLHNQQKNSNILDDYNIPFSELIHGVQCPSCSYFSMRRISGSWRCMNCLAFSKTAHIKAIEEYLLFNHTITNKQCRYFLYLTSSNTAYKLLKQTHFPNNGINKGRKYYLSEHDQQPV